MEFESEDRVGTQSNRSQKPVIWLTCQLAGLMGRVTRRRANQVTSSLTQHGLVRADDQRHVLTNDGLTYLAHRDRVAVRMTLDRWSRPQAVPQPGNSPVIAGTALRAMSSQQRHKNAITTVAAKVSAETARSRDHGLLELLPTSRCSIGYHYQGTGYVVHPDATFWLDLAHLGTCGSVPGSECRAKRRPDSCCWRRPTVRRCSTPPSLRAIGDGVPAIRR